MTLWILTSLSSSVAADTASCEYRDQRGLFDPLLHAEQRRSLDSFQRASPLLSPASSKQCNDPVCCLI